MIQHTVTILRAAAALCLLLTLGVAGCQKEVKQPLAAAPPPTFTGPAYLHGSVSSMVELRGYQPLLVSGYGLVVNLPGTGSSEVPSFLRQWLINEMRRKGLGSPRLGTEDLTPERVLASHNTAVVAIEGIIPPGAVRGSTFDVLVTALPQTQTTSLDGGVLWTADLSVEGTNSSLAFSRKLAEAAGPIYVNPFDSRQQIERLESNPTAVVLSGGTVVLDRKLELSLNQPSWERSRAIADRINERFPRGPQDREDTAVAKTDLQIELNIPARYSNNPDRLLALISRLFIQRGFNFEPQKAKELAEMLVTQPRLAEDVVDAWEALGKTTLPILRQYYQHPQLHMQLASLAAGSRLGDGLVTRAIEKLAQHPEALVRRQAAQMLRSLPDNLQGTAILRTLIDDSDHQVRIAAYESLLASGDPLITRMSFGQRDIHGRFARGTFKFNLDLVPAQKPMIVINQASIPRLTVFAPDLGFKQPLLARLWDNKLMIRCNSADELATVFYQGPGEVEGKTYQIAPTVGNLIFLLAHQSTDENPTDGLDLSYSRVVNALFLLREQGAIEADLELRVSPLVKAITRYKASQMPSVRPETGDRLPVPDAIAPQPAPAPADPQPTDAQH